MSIKKHLFALSTVAIAVVATSASAKTYTEEANIGATPAGALESNGMTGIFEAWDMYGRTVAGADVISDSTIDEIFSKLWINDADLYQITVTDYENFHASTVGTVSLALFDASGDAIAGAWGGAPNTVSEIDSSWLSGNGVYYLGIGFMGSNPRNAAGENLFNLSVAASAPVASDITLAADPAVAWEKNNLPTGIIGPGNMYIPGPISVALPEPASLALLGLGGLTVLKRR